MNILLSDGVFSYEKDNDIFSNMSFSLKKGQILSILGSNGCGKTTLLKCLVGVLPFSAGSLFFDNKDVSDCRMRSTSFGYVPQLSGSPVSYSVFQMVLMGRSRFIGTFSRPAEKDLIRVREIMEEVKISHLVNRPFSFLSGGERQLVLIARALATEAEILLFDEPTSALDLVNQHNTIELMRSLSHENGLSIIFTTHDPSHALHISDKTILMDKDSSSIFGSTSEIITEENMMSLFGVKTKIYEHINNNGGVSLGVMPILKPFSRKSVVNL